MIIFAVRSIGSAIERTFFHSEGITTSTIQREPLPVDSVNETPYYTDKLEWIGNETILLRGMKNFYRATGVQPYLYITDNVKGVHIDSIKPLEEYANELYDQLFTDEAHLLLMFYEYDGDYATYYLCGSQAKTVIDREAGDILLDYIDKFYYDDTLGDEEYFSKAFDLTAKRIMKKEFSPWIMIFILAIAVLALMFWKHRSKQKLLKAALDARILETPLEKFEDRELEDLANKYK